MFYLFVGCEGNDSMVESFMGMFPTIQEAQQYADSRIGREWAEISRLEDNRMVLVADWQCGMFRRGNWLVR